jgi:hypothetical protein
VVVHCQKILILVLSPVKIRVGPFGRITALHVVETAVLVAVTMGVFVAVTIGVLVPVTIGVPVTVACNDAVGCVVGVCVPVTERVETSVGGGPPCPPEVTTSCGALAASRDARLVFVVFVVSISRLYVPAAVM